MATINHRLRLRYPIWDDFARYYAINSDPATNTHNPHGVMTYHDAQSHFKHILNHWQQHHFGIWCISLAAEPHYPIGFGGLSYRQYGTDCRLNLGYRFDPAYWGNGYASELAQRAISFAFAELHAAAVYALVRPQHHASIRVLEKSGMIHCAMLDDVPPLTASRVYRIAPTDHRGVSMK